MQRRRFLRTAGTAGLAVATLPTMVEGLSVRALAAGDSPVHRLLESSDRILVLIQLQGGNDGLNTVVPLTSQQYYDGRPSIALRKEHTLPLTETLGWHGAMAGFRALFDEGRMAVVQGVTYPNPDRSHFRGTDIWLTSTDADVFASTGWLGRYVASLSPGYPETLPPEPLAVQIGRTSSLGLAGEAGPMGISFRDPEEFHRLVTVGNYAEVPSSLQDDTPAGREVAFMRNIAEAANVYAGVVKKAADKGTTTGTYPTTDLAQRLRVVAQLVSGGLSSRIYMVSWSNNNFDTHANQVVTGSPHTGVHANLLRELSDAVRAFMDDMRQQGKDGAIAGMTFSEFGRRVAENGSTGTDHGTAAPLFVFGGRVNGGVYGADPDLTRLDDRGDLLMQNDFRDVYSTILMQWFGAAKQTQQEVLFRDFSTRTLPLFNVPTHVAAADAKAGGRCAITAIGPNPATSVVDVAVDVAPFADAHYVVTDMTGRRCGAGVIDAWSGRFRLDVSALPPATYVLSVVADRTTVHRTIQVVR